MTPIQDRDVPMSLTQLIPPNKSKYRKTHRVRLLHNMIHTTPIALPQMMKDTTCLSKQPQRLVDIPYGEDESKSMITGSLRSTKGGLFSSRKALTTSSTEHNIDLQLNVPLKESSRESKTLVKEGTTQVRGRG